MTDDYRQGYRDGYKDGRAAAKEDSTTCSQCGRDMSQTANQFYVCMSHTCPYIKTGPNLLTEKTWEF